MRLRTRVFNYFVDMKERMFIMNAEIKKRSKVKGKYLKMYICPEKFSSLRSLHLSRHVRECKITRFSYQSDNITKRMEFMHLQVRTTSAFKRKKFAEVISPLSCVRQTLSAFPPWHESFFFPFPLLLLFAYLFHPLFPLFLSFFLLVNLSFAGSRLEANGKARKF